MDWIGNLDVIELLYKIDTIFLCFTVFSVFFCSDVCNHDLSLLIFGVTCQKGQSIQYDTQLTKHCANNNNKK